jgi:malonyl-CoA/methylmalonyl-CoA synthetase
VAAILYTSGTTGRPKGAMLTHGNLAANVEALAALWRMRRNDALLHALPLFHAHGLFVALHCALFAGARLLLLPRFAAEPVAALLSRATVYMGVPTHYLRLLALPAFGRESCAGMRLFVSGSAPLLAATHREFTARTGHEILERYGMTEALMITSNPYDARIPGSVGFALPGVELRVVDASGRALPAGEIGVLEIRGPSVFAGYWGMPEKTREEIHPDGFFVSGDLACIAADGRVTLVGRAKDLVISGGLNVYPAEVEAALDALPGVAESAVIGLAHPDLGEGVTAVVVGDGSLPLDEAAIRRGLEGRLARFKHPKRVFFVESLPRNAMGKVQKTALRERFGAAYVAVSDVRE